MSDSCWTFVMQYPGLAGVSFGLLLVTVGCFMFLRTKKMRKMEIIVFTRYPVTGKAKTRLIPALGDYGACLLQIRMTEHLVKKLEEAQELMGGEVNVTLQFNGGTEKQMHYWLDRKFHKVSCAYRPQAEGSLGLKLSTAIKDSFERGNAQVVVIGADIPGIDAVVIRDAFNSLTARPDPRMVIGAAEDGGYYLIGFSSAAKRQLENIFVDIDWGTSQVFTQQMNRARDAGLEPAVLKQVLNDVDTVDDLGVFEQEVGIDRQELRPHNWSIVLPALNEEANIKNCLMDILQKCSNSRHLSEVIVVDGGSQDRTVEHVKEFSQTSPIPVHIVHSKPGRGKQQIAGADTAKGDNLLFLHADTKLPQNFDLHAAQCLITPGNAAGAFEFYLNVLEDDKLLCTEPWWFIQEMRFCVWLTNKRAKNLELPYGDQALFMSKKTYQDVGGFPPYHLMEDFCIVKRLQKLGHVHVVNGQRATTDYRRWRKWGYFKITGLNQCIILAYKCGIHPNTLARWYYGDKLKTD